MVSYNKFFLLAERENRIKKFYLFRRQIIYLRDREKCKISKLIWTSVN